LHRNRTYGGFVDAVCDKAFVIPCWISLLHVVPTTHYFNAFQYATFIALILAETASGCVRFQAFYTSGGVAAPKVETTTSSSHTGLDFSTSAVQADHVGKAKQTFEMVGTALYIFNMTTRYIGLAFLMLVSFHIVDVILSSRHCCLYSHISHSLHHHHHHHFVLGMS
jgi:phosphatidylglycerophosphate synthase